jgi:hypothetical protein
MFRSANREAGGDLDEWCDVTTAGKVGDRAGVEWRVSLETFRLAAARKAGRELELETAWIAP